MEQHYTVKLKPGIWRRGEREWHGDETHRMNDSDTKHFMGMSLVEDTDHPDWGNWPRNTKRKTVVTPQGPERHIPKKLQDKSWEEIESYYKEKFDNREYVSYESFITAMRVDKELLDYIGADKWFE